MSLCQGTPIMGSFSQIQRPQSQVLCTVDLSTMMGGEAPISVNLGAFSCRISFSKCAKCRLKMAFSTFPFSTSLVDYAQLVLQSSKSGRLAQCSRGFVAFQRSILLSQVDMQVTNSFIKCSAIRVSEGEGHVQVSQRFTMGVQAACSFSCQPVVFRRRLFVASSSIMIRNLSSESTITVAPHMINEYFGNTSMKSA